ncbi:MAG: radical SAM protein [Phycisphaerales bacterium]|nr:radical SAM protein [Hyphomonadaceae bacterium]
MNAPLDPYRKRAPWQKAFSAEELAHGSYAGFIGDEGVVVDGVRYRNITVTPFDGAYYLVSSKATLTFNLTAVCNAACSFCFNGATFFPDVNSSAAQASRSFERSVAFAQAGGVANVSFSGGEPTLLPAKLLNAIEVSRTLPGFKRLHTNGSRVLKRRSDGGVLLDALIQQGLGEVSLSRAAIDQKLNAALMRMPDSASLADAELAVLAAAIRTRLSCFMLPDGVADVEGVRRYIEWGRRLGVNDFVFRLPSNLPQRYTLSSSYAEANSALNDLTTAELRDALCAEGWTETFSRQEADYDLYILRHGATEISVDRGADVPDPDRKIRRLIHMPNNLLYSSWLSSSSFIFDADRAAMVDSLSRVRVDRPGRYPAADARARTTPAPVRYDHDMHLHSTVSDGMLCPSEVVHALLAGGVRRAVFTEHNGVHPNWPALQAYAAECGLDCPIPATEVSANYYAPDGEQAFRVHVLVYGPGVLDAAFHEWIAGANNAEIDFISEVYERLLAQWPDLPPIEEIYRVSDPVSELSARKLTYNRTPLAEAVSRLANVSVDHAKNELIGKISADRKTASGLDCVSLVRWAEELGCVTVLAHPAWVRNIGVKSGTFDSILQAVAHLHAEGLDGIEVTHRLNDDDTRLRLWQLASTLDMLETGGSDFHGKPRDVIGVHGASERQFEQVLARIGHKEKQIGVRLRPHAAS